ncbi:DUF2971 domain-containing protein [Ruegeria atlantica]|uniref:DUF2971 domain-containing protein n=1 Tax=Ruegeria atlantica TaxID=81569 RepID=UPI001479B1AF|nr:DUF2971 domain-containing protein [Ruegeria atlantica]
MDQRWAPNRLYRFCKPEHEHFEDELHNLSMGKVWLNHINRMNDPFEGALVHEPQLFDEFSSQITQVAKHWPQVTQVTKENYEEYLRGADKFAAQLLTKAVAACFSQSWNSPLMWGHYASSFEGFCLEYEYDTSVMSVEDIPMHQVIYWRETPPKITTFEYFRSMYYEQARQSEDVSLNRTAAHLRVHTLEPVLLGMTSKSFEWVYEQEFRMVSGFLQPGYYEIPHFGLKSVIFGHRAEQSKIDEVKYVLGESCRYWQIQILGERYSLSRRQI